MAIIALWVTSRPTISPISNIPIFEAKIEIEPYAKEIDPTTGYTKLGWNLFVLGNQRIYLGETEHADLASVTETSEDGRILIHESFKQPFRMGRTARNIVNFVTRVLSNSESGLIKRVDTLQPANLNPGGNNASSSMFERPKAIRPEGGSQH